MLLRHDVLNMMPQVAMFLAQMAILATVASPPADQFPDRRVHVLLNLRGQVELSFELEYRYEIRRVNQRFIFRAIVIA